MCSRDEYAATARVYTLIDVRAHACTHARTHTSPILMMALGSLLGAMQDGPRSPTASTTRWHRVSRRTTVATTVATAWICSCERTLLGAVYPLAVFVYQHPHPMLIGSAHCTPNGDDDVSGAVAGSRWLSPADNVLKLT